MKAKRNQNRHLFRITEQEKESELSIAPQGVTVNMWQNSQLLNPKIENRTLLTTLQKRTISDHVYGSTAHGSVRSTEDHGENDLMELDLSAINSQVQFFAQKFSKIRSELAGKLEGSMKTEVIRVLETL